LTVAGAGDVNFVGVTLEDEDDPFDVHADSSPKPNAKRGRSKAKVRPDRLMPTSCRKAAFCDIPWRTEERRRRSPRTRFAIAVDLDRRLRALGYI
jgi:hypothetical protein